MRLEHIEHFILGLNFFDLCLLFLVQSWTDMKPRFERTQTGDGVWMSGEQERHVSRLSWDNKRHLGSKQAKPLDHWRNSSQELFFLRKKNFNYHASLIYVVGLISIYGECVMQMFKLTKKINNWTITKCASLFCFSA